MTPSRHDRAFVAVWIDHHQARVFHVTPDGFDVVRVGAPGPHAHRHPKGAAEPHEHPADLKHLFDGVADALRGAQRILLVGPSTAKLQLLRHLRERAHEIEARVIGIETVNHPTDPELAAYARRYFELDARR